MLSLTSDSDNMHASFIDKHASLSLFTIPCIEFKDECE